MNTAQKRVCLVGATGLIGRTVIEKAVSRSDVRIVGVARREMKLPYGARMEMLLAPTSGWPDAIAAANASVLVCALGTTIHQVEGDKEAFRAVDYDLVVACAKAAKKAGIEHMIVVSSVDADRSAKSFYLQVKGEVEEALAKVGFKRLDILRPGLLIGQREESRSLERIGMWLSPLLGIFLHGKYRKYRSIRASTVADAIFALCRAKARGRFVHDHDAMHYAIRKAGD